MQPTQLLTLNCRQISTNWRSISTELKNLRPARARHPWKSAGVRDRAVQSTAAAFALARARIRRGGAVGAGGGDGERAEAAARPAPRVGRLELPRPGCVDGPAAIPTTQVPGGGGILTVWARPIQEAQQPPPPSL